MFRKWNIALRLTILVMLGAGFILGSVVGYCYYSARNLLEEELETKAHFIAQATANQMETVEKSVEKIAQGLALQLETNNTAPQEEIYGLLQKNLDRNPEIIGTAVAFAPFRFDPDIKYFAPYAYRNNDRIAQDNLGKEEYHYYIEDWYNLPKELRSPVWSEPYYDAGGGNTLMVTYSVPFYDNGQNGAFRGVVTCDVSLHWLTSLLASLPLDNSGYAFLISKNGTFISHPMKNYIISQNIFSKAEELNDPTLRSLGKSMVKGKSGFIPFTGLGMDKPCWLAYVPVTSTGWSLGIIFTQEELLSKVIKLSKVAGFLGFTGFVLLLLVVLTIARSITRPIRQLDQAAQTLAAGNLDATLPQIDGGDEVASLADSFATMRGELKIYMEQLQETVAAKERIQSELRIAQTIQMSLVPKTFPPFPNRKEFELYALMEPAKEVGGDFYDFFLVDDDNLCLVIGDVSGKGVPAALFMAVTRTFLRALFQEESDPAIILSRLNDELSRDNDSCMFVTIFCASINISTGECRYASAGHNPPFLVTVGQEVTTLPPVKGAVAGAMEGLPFAEGVVYLHPGDMLFLYTDGVTEAMNQEASLFGETATTKELQRLQNLNCDIILKELRQSLWHFAAGAEQSDDITMLAFRYFGETKETKRS